MTTEQSTLQARMATLPAIDSLLAEPVLGAAGLPERTLLVRLCRRRVEELREALLAGKRVTVPTAAELAARIAREARELIRAGMGRVINATGVVLHTGLGRAPLPPAAGERLQQVLAGFTDLEFRLESGTRGVRHSRVAEQLCLLTGAEAALVCNNNAAAVLLMLNGLCRRREVVVSRGQQVEIGGGFRIPDVIRQSGARMVEVGTTNRTHLEDYAEAIGPRTAALLRVHPSNYRVIGFTASVDTAELAGLARERGCLLLDDLGSGALVDLAGFDPPEPPVWQSLEAGADMVTFSGDKLLGASQAGLLVGRRDLIRNLERNPLLRALRCDKLTLAVLEAVLGLYLAGGETRAALPVLRMLGESGSVVRSRALACLELLGLRGEGPHHLGAGTLWLESSRARTGSGALPEQDLESAALVMTHEGLSAERLHRRIRTGSPAVVGAVREERLYLDFKAVLPGEEELLAGAIAMVLGATDGPRSPATRTVAE